MEQIHDETVALEPRSGLGAKGRVALVVFAASAAFFFWAEHRAHVIQYLPWGILALCPLMHMLMHRGHAAGRGNQADRNFRGGGRAS